MSPRKKFTALDDLERFQPIERLVGLFQPCGNRLGADNFGKPVAQSLDLAELSQAGLTDRFPSLFSAIKRKFGDSVRSKTDTAMANEVPCKILCHNICCLIHEQHELGIEPVFWPEESDQATILAMPTTTR